MVGSSLLQFWIVPPVVFILDRRARDLGPAGHRDGRGEGGGGGGAGGEGGVGGVGVGRGGSVARQLFSHSATCRSDNINYREGERGEGGLGVGYLYNLCAPALRACSLQRRAGDDCT